MDDDRRRRIFEDARKRTIQKILDAREKRGLKPLEYIKHEKMFDLDKYLKDNEQPPF